MLNSLKGLMLTLSSTLTGLRRPVTREYPKTPTPVQPRFMGFPALTWDGDIEEPFCTACMVCIRQCPTQCMSANMKDNPLHEEGASSRRKIVDHFEINLNRCTQLAQSGDIGVMGEGHGCGCHGDGGIGQKTHVNCA